MTAEEWIEKFAAELGVEPPSGEEFSQILELAAEAAHASERTAAPVACWLAGRTGTPLAGHWSSAAAKASDSASSAPATSRVRAARMATRRP